MSQIEVVNFTGFGNATADTGRPIGDFEVRQAQWLFHPAVALAVGSRADISFGPLVQRSVTDGSRSRYVADTRPYGYGTFDQAGLQFGARYEWRVVRDNVEHTHHRILAQLNAFYFPAAMDVRSPFEVVTASVGSSLTLPVPAHPILVVRAGGTKLWGDFPFHEAATIGGEGTLRYLDTQRYSGDASAYVTSELRVPVAHFKLLIPLRAGILGLAEAGRVYENGASPGGWHSRTGEGIWFGRGDASSIVTLTRTTEPGHAGLRIRLGLNF